MKKLILHIGRNKSGTTAIQRFLKGSSEYLSSRDFYYPATGTRSFAHHPVAESMKSRPISRGVLLSSNAFRILQELHQEVDSAAEQKIILSSEAFQGCRPDVVKEAFGRYDTRVVVYIRNQLDYLTSAYSQRVHANNYCNSLDDFFTRDQKVDYFSFLNSWDRAFSNALIVRRYSPETLEQNDVVSDFVFHALGDKLGGAAPLDFEHNANPSLNSKLVQFKLYLNQEGYCHDESHKYLYRVLPEMNNDFPSGPLRANSSLKEKVISRCMKSNNAVAEKYFDNNQLFDYSTYQSKEVTPLDPDERELMMLKLREKLAEKLVDLDQFRRS